MLGAWRVERRHAGEAHDTVRLTFHRDGRFGALVDDGRALVWGSWSVDDEQPRGADAALHARLALRYDHGAARSAVYRMAMASPPLGPVVLTTARAAGPAPARLELARELPRAATLVGRWRIAPSVAWRDESGFAFDALHLGEHGAFAADGRNGTTRTGRWALEADAAAVAARAIGTLVLDPADRAAPVQRWIATTGPTHRGGAAHANGVVLTEHGLDAACSIRMERVALDPLVRLLIAAWRRYTSAATTRVPLEFALHADGTLGALASLDAPRLAGRWSAAAVHRGADRVFVTLAVTLRPHGHGAAHDRWHVTLPFGRNAELEVYSERDGGTARCRRLFR